MKLATVVIPISPEHEQMAVYQDAIESVRQQTISCELITIHDRDKRGAAWARNQGTAQVETPFVIWLDADDILLPRFVECTVQAYQSGAYVYTDWRLHGKDKIVPPILSPHTQGQEHVITTLMPIAAWRDTGGFDESLDSLEDEDFYRKLHAYGWKGVKADYIGLDYRRNRGFSKVNSEAVDPDIQKKRIEEKQTLFEKRYRRFAEMFVFVSGKQKPQTPIVGERKANDVLCEANYSPMRQVGAITKRSYPRAGLSEPIWVDIDDAQARPDLWRIIAHNPDKISPDVERVKELYERAQAEKERIEREVVEGYAMPCEYEDTKPLPIISDEPITLPDKELGYDGMLLDELRQEFAKRDLSETELTGGVSVHWKILRKLMIGRLKDLEHEKTTERTQTPVENP